MWANLKDKHVYLLFTLFFIIQLLLINPIGEFALNDDWVHSLAIANYVEHGFFVYPTWLSPNLHVNIGYGIILTKIFGFSFSIFRISNLIFSIVTIFLFYRLLRTFQIVSGLSMLLSFLLWFNPLFLNLSYTFMSDIPSLFFLLLAILFYHHGIKNIKKKSLFIGSIICVIGFFIRQVNILPMLAVGVYYLWQKKRIHIKDIWYPFLMPILILIISYIIAARFGYLPGTVQARLLPEGWSYTEQIIKNLWHVTQLMAIFVLPVTLAIFIKNFTWLKTRKFWYLIMTGVIFLIIGYYTDYIFPNLGNMINLNGLGPSNTVLQGVIKNWGHALTYLFVVSLSVINVVILVMCNRKIFAKFSFNIFFKILLILYLLIILPVFTFDRYLLFVLPIILVYCGLLLSQIAWSRAIFVLLLLGFMLYSTIGTFNYLAWNNVRWQEANHLVIEGVDLSDIEAGYEWNGWNLSAKKVSFDHITPKWAPWYIKDITPWHQMKYVIAFSPLGGYEVIRKTKVPGLFSNVKFIFVNKVVPNSLNQ